MTLQIQHPSVLAAVVLQDGKCVAHSAGAGKCYPQYSITKSLTSLAAGMLISEGNLSLDTAAGSLLPIPENAPLAAVTLRELLTMHSGLAQQLLFADRKNYPDHLAACVAQPVVEKRFLYNNADFYLAGRMAEAAAGEPLGEFLSRRIFRPLGIEEYALEYDPQGHYFGASGLNISTYDLAKLGQSVLEKTLYPKDYLEAAARRQTVSDDGRDYGYGFWLYGDVISMNGKWGQHCLIFPARRAVIAVNADLRSVPEMTAFIRETLLPCIS